MRAVFEVDPRALEEASDCIAAAVAALAGGRLVVFPTETVYGIGSRPDDPAATERLFAAKRRPSGLNLPVLVASGAAAWEVVRPDPRARRLAAAFWPGPLTIVLSRTDRSARWYLGREWETVGVRVPDHPVALRLLDAYGPVAATSANLSGRPPLRARDELEATFGASVEVYLLVAPGIMPPRELPSTVVNLACDPPRLERRGPVDTASLEEVLGEPVQPSG